VFDHTNVLFAGLRLNQQRPEHTDRELLLCDLKHELFVGGLEGAELGDAAFVRYEAEVLEVVVGVQGASYAF
jgi:hypothetical protein